MVLKLSVISYHRYTSDIEKNKSLFIDPSEVEFVIGRSEQCDWYLADPERVISGKHAKITKVDDKFYLFDTSTNGVFINRSVSPLGKSAPHQLALDDLLTIGDYEIKVQFYDADNSLNHNENNDSQKAAVTKLSMNCEDDGQLEFGIKINPKVLNTNQHAKLQQTSLTNSRPALSNSHLAQNLEQDAVVMHESKMDIELQDAFQFPSFSESTIPEDWHQSLDLPEDTWLDPARVQESGVITPEKTVSLHQKTQLGQEKAHISSQEKSNSALIIGNHEESQLQAFLSGLGISPQIVDQHNAEQWWQQLGVIVRDSLDGLMDTLHDRSAFKQSNRINQTTFKRSENNPLKFSSTTEDALLNLLNRKSSGFLPAERAIKEAFQDVRKHDEAVLKGMEASIGAVINQFDPSLISQVSDSKGALAKVAVFGDSQRRWKRFCQLHQQLKDEFNGTDAQFYIEDFSKAYESYLKQNERKG